MPCMKNLGVVYILRLLHAEVHFKCGRAVCAQIESNTACGATRFLFLNSDKNPSIHL